jgi:hypothetical protein
MTDSSISLNFAATSGRSRQAHRWECQMGPPSNQYLRPPLQLASYSIQIRHRLRDKIRHSRFPSPRAIIVPVGWPHDWDEMDQWTVAVLGDGGVGKTALAVSVSTAEIFSVPGQC